MAYIQSSRITAFPLAKDRASDRKSNLFYEENIANIVNQLIDTQGFIITKITEENNFMSVVNGQLQMSAGNVFQFSLGGRLFTITSGDSDYNIMDVTSAEKVYAYIKLDDKGEVLGQDNVGGLYEGLVLATSLPNDNDADYVLPLFTINDPYVEIPDESYLKLTLESFAPAIKIIDGQR